MKSRHVQFTPPGPRVEKRVSRLMARLTRAEKIHLLGGAHQATRSLPGQGVPVLRMADGPMGIHWWCERATAYPATLALAATWDPGWAYRAGAAVGRDARARGIHILLGPGLNLYRSPLCGRNFEYLGEDPELTATLACAFVRGVQDQGVAATAKHFALNFQEYDRHQISSDVDARTLREVYLVAFERVVREAGVGAVMTAYNLVNGRHASEHDELINGILKGDWGFDGVVMSDWASTYSAVGAAQAGLDLEMPTGRHLNEALLAPALEAGLVTEKMIDDKVRRLLRLAVCFGWLDREQRDDRIPESDPATMEVALEVARRGFVLLRNEGSWLPWSPGALKRIAVLGGQAADPQVSGGGSAYTPPTRVVTLLDGVRELAGPGVEVTYHPAVRDPDFDQMAEKCEFFTRRGEAGLEVEYFSNRRLSGTPALSRIEPRLNYRWKDGGTPFPAEVSRDQFSVRWTGVIRPRQSGPHQLFLYAIDGAVRCWLDERCVCDASHLSGGLFRAEADLEAGCDARLVVEYVQMRPFGWCHLLGGWYHEDDQRVDYAAALQAARAADAVVVCVGFTKHTEGEGFDRAFALDRTSEQLILDACAAQPATAVVLHAGGGVDLSRWGDRVRALLHAWYPGQEGGRAAAEILFGVTNPSGRLPITMEQRLEDRSSFTCYHDHDGDGRVALSDGVFGGHRHVDRNGQAPRYAFGFGLSYTRFAYRDLRLSPARLRPGQSLRVSVQVGNTGARAGDEIVQVYVGDVASRLPRPVRELKGFRRVSLRPGQWKTVTFVLKPRALSYYDPDARAWVAEPGRFEVWVGASSADLRLQAGFVLVSGRRPGRPVKRRRR
jgi:beta-glucosidase